MAAFTIDADNNLTFLASLKEVAGIEEGRQAFSSAEELANLVGEWPAARLVEIWNSLPGVEPVPRFTSRQVAVKRIWKVIQQLNASTSEHGPAVATMQCNSKNKPRTKAQPTAGKNNKTARVIALLRKREGASLKALRRATGWQAHSVRGFISNLKRRLGHKVRSFARDGERVYSLKS